MSHSHIRKPKTPSQPVARWNLALVMALLLGASAALFTFIYSIRLSPQNYETTQGRILEMRKVIDGAFDTKSGGKIIYGVEARVQYTWRGQTQQRWMRAASDMPKEFLLQKVANPPSECRVYWPPQQPDNARCWVKE